MEGQGGIPPQQVEQQQGVLPGLVIRDRLMSAVSKAPKFDPAKITWSDWLIKIRSWAEVTGITDEAVWKMAVFNRIEGQNFATIAPYGPWSEPYSTMSYLEYVSFLGEFFQPKANSELKKTEYISRKQGKSEGVIPYVTSKYRLWQLAYEDGNRSMEDFIKTAIKGFYSTEVKKRVNQMGPNNYTELLDCATLVVAQERFAYAEGFSDATSLDGLAATSVAVAKSVIAGCQTPMEVDELGAVGAVEGNECYHCGIRGHYKRECRKFLRGEPKVKNKDQGRSMAKNWRAGGEPSKSGRRMDQEGRGGSGYQGGRSGAGSGN